MIGKMTALFFATLVLFSCNSNASEETGNQEDGIRLSGQVGFPKDGHIVLKKIQQDGEFIPLDTFALKEDYTYSGSVEVPAPGFYQLDFFNTQQVNLILDKDNVEVNVDGNDPQGFVEIRGSRDHDFIQYVQNTLSQMQSSPRAQDINQRFVQAREAGEEEKMSEIQMEYIAYDDSVKSVIVDSMRSLGPSLGAIEVLRNKRLIDWDKNFAFLDEYSEAVRKEMPDSPEAMSFVSSVDAVKFLAMGKEAPEIALPNPDGEIVKLSSLRGNYVLVDFWAKWCRPCRMENPNIVRQYRKYNDEGFEVYGVSLDRTRADWVQAIEEDELHWTQVSDLKFWNSEAARTYDINSIPYSLLLDPEGKIIGKNLRGPALGEKLEEIFGK